MGTEEILFINIIFKDILCIASTCLKLKKIIKNQKVTRDKNSEFFDKIDVIFAKIEDIVRLTGGHIDDQEKSKFEDCIFIKKFDLLDYGGRKDEKYNIDRFIRDNIIRISFANMVRKLSSEKYVSFIKKLVQQYIINSEERKNLTILKLQDIERFGSCLSLLHVLAYIHHENINTIIMPIKFFAINVTKYSGLLNNLFDNFPKLYRLGIGL
uniref:Uncharacterized protein n=1 Tax=Strongyloides venezuelensis TaxID=75913 RepID=A0A0K0EYY3_STRVS